MTDEINRLATSSDVASKNIDQLTKSLQGLNDMSKPLIEAIKGINEPMESLSSGFDIIGLLDKFSSIKGAVFDVLDIFDVLGAASTTTSTTMVSSLSNATGFLMSTLGSAGSATSALGVSASSLTTSLTTTTTATSSLGTIMSFLATNPIGMVIGGMGLAIGALAIFGGNIDMTSEKTKENIKVLENKKQKLDSITESLKNNTQATKDNVDSIQDDFAGTMAYFDELKNMEATGGIAGSMEKTKFLVEQINKVLPDSVSITKDNTLAWKGNSDEVRKNIELLEKKALVEAHQEEYIEAMKTRSKLQAELTAASAAYNTALEKQEATRKAALEAGKNGDSKRANELTTEFQNLVKETGKYKEVLDSAKGAMAASDESVNNYKTSLQALDGTVESSSKALLESYGTVSEDGLHTYGSLAKGLMDLNQKEKDYAEGKIQLSQEEIDINTRTRELIIEEMKKKADGFGNSYDDMVATLEERGVYLTDLEKTQLKERFENQQTANQEKEGSQAISLDNMLLALEEKGLVLNEKEKAILGEQYQAWQDTAAGKEGVQTLSYENLIAKLEEGGRKLTSDEKEQLKEQYNAWKQNATDKEITLSTSYSNMKDELNSLMTGMNEDQKSKLNESIEILSKSGSKGGLELCQKLATSLVNSKGQVNDEVQGILDEIDRSASAAKPTTKVGVVGPSMQTLRDVCKYAQENLMPILISVGINAVTSFLGGSKGVSQKANGGFVNTGELFVAREAGPELVGRINGKTAVANNDQIVSGISAGVYNAVTSAMSGAGNKGNLNINAIFTMDGEVVGRQVIKYHNGVVKRTGKTPLLV